MNLAFSTRGWRDNDWMKQVEDACEMSFRGIEVYNLHKISFLTERGGPFHKYSRNETDRMLQELGLKIPCFLDFGVYIRGTSQKRKLLYARY